MEVYYFCTKDCILLVIKYLQIFTKLTSVYIYLYSSAQLFLQNSQVITNTCLIFIAKYIFNVFIPIYSPHQSLSAASPALGDVSVLKLLSWLVCSDTTL